MKIFIICLCALLLSSGCITSGAKIKLTDKTGNPVTITDQGLGLDIQQLELDGYEVEVINEEVTDDTKD